MAVNKFMHPRNIYRHPPDFVILAKKYAEFASIAKMDITGRVSIDFKDPHSLRVLTKCLLKSDFNLDVDIPEDRLVPTLPLRLNYILWVEDILKAINNGSEVCGLDIGTGACAVYPLLAAAKNKWHMIGTETDDASLLKAQQNVQKNNLQEIIAVKKNPTSTVIEYVLSEEQDKIYHFTMCNPPFYSSFQELWESRSPARVPPKNGFTGSPQELITEGGELEFCKKFIDESKNHKNRVLVYTTMVGHKYNLKELVEYLKSEGIKNTHTEFCQGRVTRWGLAWTYQDYDIYTLVPPRDQPRKKKLPIAFLLPQIPNSSYDVETTTNKLKAIMNALHINYKVINKRGNNILLDIVAPTNTWSNQRRKRRLMKRLVTDDPKRPKMKDVTESTSKLSTTPDSQSIPNTKSDEVSEELSSINDTNTDTEPNTNPVVHATLKIVKKDCDIIMEMEFLSGTGGKEGLHQIVQYIKNNWK
ncbi:U6 small nuclear RNA (adenine-(43)-N(6))-methyltransferase [Amyelois transitella]|uniref:U6 small nuclear RNA (adenine-(43)-N(6))-methyltransferase n=1 Tax=Amyelois transitella TaxID=680683 RepID=UPI0029903C6C|nr:U6 small nuclear RNA (adenine-(43)-N(6))-methyltransferase [Amyelois transitella]XP_060803229.1 U6 small nuclear RNA (adenine-(43)-N(6))-methyltransferase [Amyelois transitella]